MDARWKELQCSIDESRMALKEVLLAEQARNLDALLYLTAKADSVTSLVGIALHYTQHPARPCAGRSNAPVKELVA